MSLNPVTYEPNASTILFLLKNFLEKEKRLPIEIFNQCAPVLEEISQEAEKALKERQIECKKSLSQDTSKIDALYQKFISQLNNSDQGFITKGILSDFSQYQLSEPENLFLFLLGKKCIEQARELNLHPDDPVKQADFLKSMETFAGKYLEGTPPLKLCGEETLRFFQVAGICQYCLKMGNGNKLQEFFRKIIEIQKKFINRLQNTPPKQPQQLNLELQQEYQQNKAKLKELRNAFRDRALRLREVNIKERIKEVAKKAEPRVTFVLLVPKNCNSSTLSS